MIPEHIGQKTFLFIFSFHLLLFAYILFYYYFFHDFDSEEIGKRRPKSRLKDTNMWIWYVVWSEDIDQMKLLRNWKIYCKLIEIEFKKSTGMLWSHQLKNYINSSRCLIANEQCQAIIPKILWHEYLLIESHPFLLLQIFQRRYSFQRFWKKNLMHFLKQAPVTMMSMMC